MFYLSIIVPIFRICIIIDRAVGAPGHVKYVVGSHNSRDKQMHNLAMAKLLNTKLILDDPIFKLMQVH